MQKARKSYAFITLWQICVDIVDNKVSQSIWRADRITWFYTLAHWGTHFSTKPIDLSYSSDSELMCVVVVVLSVRQSPAEPSEREGQVKKVRKVMGPHLNDGPTDQIG